VTRLVEVEQRCLGGVYGMRMSDKCDGVLEKRNLMGKCGKLFTAWLS